MQWVHAQKVRCINELLLFRSKIHPYDSTGDWVGCATLSSTVIHPVYPGFVIYIHEAPDSASRLVSFDADSYSHNVEVRSGDAESGASYNLPLNPCARACVYMCVCVVWSQQKLLLVLLFKVTDESFVFNLSVHGLESGHAVGCFQGGAQSKRSAFQE